MEAVGRAGLVTMIATLLLASTLGGFLVCAHQTADDHGNDGFGYSIEDAVLNERMMQLPGCLDIRSDHTSALYDFGERGMVCHFASPGDKVTIKKDQAADTFVTTVEIGEMDLVGRGNFQVQLKFEVSQGISYIVDVHIDQFETYITYSYEKDGLRVIGYGDMIYDAVDSLDLLVHVDNGALKIGISGIEDVINMPIVTKWSPRFAGIVLGAGAEDPVMGNVYMKTFILGLGTGYHYYNGLHKTIVPDGKDFAFSLHIHADRSYPEYFYLMANLSQEYGLRGTHDAWLWANSQFYSMDEPEYTAGLHALQNSGWDIGTHALGYRDLDRSQVVYGLDRMTEEFGPLRTWSDHGQRVQDLWREGTDPDSGYYDADLIEEIGAAWMHKNSKAHSFYNDLNRDGMSYQDPDNPNLPLFRVSQMQAWMIYTNPGREEDLDRYMRAWTTDRSVFVAHDYFPYFFYVNNKSGPLCILPNEEGIGYFPWSSLVPKATFVSESWSPLPEFTRFLNWTKGYDVWFAPVRDIYDRSCLVQKVVVQEDAEKLIIRNPSNEQIDGLTLFTQDSPLFSLKNDGKLVGARQGNGESWSFVFDIGPGEELVLEKVKFVNDDRSLPIDSFLDMKDVIAGTKDEDL